MSTTSIANKSWIAIIVSALFCVYKLVEAKYLEDTKLPIKYIVRDCIAVYLSVWIGAIILEYSEGDITEFVEAITDSKNQMLGAAGLPAVAAAASSSVVFTDDPGF
jgi:hypothetical protein